MRLKIHAQLACWVLGGLVAAFAGASASAAMPRCDLTAGRQTIEVEAAGVTRSVHVYIPATFRMRSAMPLILNLHGSGSNGAQQLDRSGLIRLADHHHVIVASPDGGLTLPSGGLAWNIPGVPTTAGQLPPDGAPDDVAFITKLIDVLVVRGCADPARVYVTGLSGGGRMTSYLGCVLSDRLAAIAPVVGLRAGSPDPDSPEHPSIASCRPREVMPVIAFSGDTDTTNPIAGGGAKYWRYSLLAAERRWANIDGCGGVVLSNARSLHSIRRRYVGCKQGAAVVSYVKRGGSHSWMVADLNLMWRFMAAHPRTGSRAIKPEGVTSMQQVGTVH
jgi:polyhydroxybutyrate depolymerase